MCIYICVYICVYIYMCIYIFSLFSIQIERKNVPIPSECIFESVQKQILELNNGEDTP